MWEKAVIKYRVGESKFYVLENAKKKAHKILMKKPFGEEVVVEEWNSDKECWEPKLKMVAKAIDDGETT